MPLASARQHPENQKESQAGHSSERTVEGQEIEFALCPEQPRHAREGGSGSAAFLSARRVFCCVVLAFGLVAFEKITVTTRKMKFELGRAPRRRAGGGAAPRGAGLRRGL